MNTIILNDDGTLYVKIADVVRAFGGEFVTVEDENETATRAAIAANGIELEAYFYNGVAHISLLPIMRQYYANAGATPVEAILNMLLTFNLEVYENNNIICTKEISTRAMYVVATSRAVYAGERYITYNPNFPNASEQAFTFFVNHGNTITFYSTSHTPLQIRGRNGLAHTSVTQFLADPPKDAVIHSNVVHAITGDDLLTGQLLTIHVEIDNRKDNVIFLRWLDCYGMMHTRTFSFGGRTISANTANKYEPARIGNISGTENAYATIADKTTTEIITFGDDAINEKYFPEIESLISSPKVQLYDKKTNSFLRVILTDTSITQKPREHVFNFSCEITLFKQNNIQW